MIARKDARARGLSAALVALGTLAGTAGLAAGATATARPVRAARHALARRHGRSGGTLTVLESFLSWTSGLDPQTNLQAPADQSLEDAIFGELFELGPAGKVVDDLASGARLSDGGRTLTITVRRGVRFSDGTPFDAKAVASNLQADLTSSCTCRPTWPVRSITTPDAHEVVVHLAHPDGAIVDQFLGSIANWVVDPHALRTMGATSYGERPVGAGPFEVVSDTTSSKLVLRRNPRYWQKGRPYLKGLVFQVVSLQTAAIEDLRAGSGQALEALSSASFAQTLRAAGFQTTLEPSTSPLFLALDLSKKPFERPKARRALYEATDAALLDRVLNGGAVPVTESFTGPTGRFYEPKVPGYPPYDLKKAKRLVRSLGGLRFTLVVSPFFVQGIGAALQSMYEHAGMKVTLATKLQAGWGAVVSSLGSFDPAGPSGLTRYATTPRVGALVREGEATVGAHARARVYARLAAAFARAGLGPFLYPPALWSVAAKGVRGPGLTTELPSVGFAGPAIFWQDVSLRR